MKIPVRKEEFVEDAEKEAADVDQQYSDGLITDGEKYNKIIDIWSKATDKITKEMMDEMAVEFMPDISGKVQEIKVLTLFILWLIPAPVVQKIRFVSWRACVV